MGIGVYSASSDNVNIQKVHISHAKNGAQYDVIVGGKNAFIADSYFLNSSGIGASLSSDYAYVQNCIFSVSRLRSGNAYDVAVSENTELELYNSVIANSVQYGFSTSSSKNRLRNCIIYNNLVNVQKSAGALLDEDYNIFGSGFTPVGSHSLTADPLFVDPTNNDFKLKTGSPGIDTGTSLSPIFNQDIIGTVRPQGAAWDRGAYEYTGGISGASAQAETINAEAPSLSILSWFKGFLTANTIKEITGYFLRIKA
jgi:hypothetical protein